MAMPSHRLPWWFMGYRHLSKIKVHLQAWLFQAAEATPKDLRAEDHLQTAPEDAEQQVQPLLGSQWTLSMLPHTDLTLSTDTQK